MSTSKSKPTASKTRKPSQTAQILENVEMLLALHEDQSVQPTPAADAFDPKPLETSIETLINRRFEQLEKQLLEKAPASAASPTTGEDVSQSIDALVELVSDQLNQQTTLIDKKISELAGSANKSKASQQSPNLQKEFKQLNDKFSELQKSLKQQQSTSGGKNASGKNAGGKNANGKHNTQANSPDLKKELGGFESKLDALSNDLQSIQQAFDNQSENFEKIIRELAASSLNANASSGPIAASTKQVEAPVSLNDTSEDPSGHWQAQKEAMLAKYGIDPDYRPVDETEPAKQGPDASALIDVEDAAAEKLGELHDTINKISPEDKDAIDKLKKDLNSKLRDAEVELSIHRARLSQEKAQLEQKTADLERRAADMEARLKASKIDQQANGKKNASDSFMSRFTRHLGK
jgi:peptidoglycan hydrolase CwlO-like protein